MPLVVFGLIALVVLVFVVATPQAGRRFLARWGVLDADEAQALIAADYLRDRRLLYLPLVLFTPSVLALSDDEPLLVVLSLLRHCLPVLVVLLVAEAFSALRRVPGPRAATLSRRAWRDLVPRWAVVVLLALAATAVTISAVGLFVPPSSRQPAFFPHGGTVVIVVVLGLALVSGVVSLAVWRGAVADPLIDTALRTRSARVAVGVGMALMAYLAFAAYRSVALLSHVWQPVYPVAFALGVLALPVGLVAWFRVVRPARAASNTRPAP